MDRTLLERMVGAVVLVLLLVVLAPALLDGGADNNKETAIRSQDESGKRTEVIILNAPVNAQPKPAAPAKPKQQATVVAQRKSPEKTVRSPTGQSAPGSGTAMAGAFAVQLGSFSERDNARRFAAGVKTEGYTVFVQKGAAAGGAVYRVYSGPAATREAAAKLAARLKSAGHNVMVVELGSGSGG